MRRQSNKPSQTKRISQKATTNFSAQQKAQNSGQSQPEARANIFKQCELCRTKTSAETETSVEVERTVKKAESITFALENDGHDNRAQTVSQGRSLIEGMHHLRKDDA